jgi:hypothetical protein
LFIGYTSVRTYEISSFDWWIVAANGGEAAKTGVRDVLAHCGLHTAMVALAVMPAPQITIPDPGC